METRRDATLGSNPFCQYNDDPSTPPPPPPAHLRFDQLFRQRDDHRQQPYYASSPERVLSRDLGLAASGGGERRPDDPLSLGEAVRVELLDECLHLRVVDGLLLEKHLGQLLPDVAVGEHRLLAHLVRVRHQLDDLLVDPVLSLGRGALRTKPAVALVALPRGRAELLHRVAPLRHHPPRPSSPCPPRRRSPR